MDRDSKFVWIDRLIEVCNKMIPEMLPEVLKNLCNSYICKMYFDKKQGCISCRYNVCNCTLKAIGLN